MEITKNSVEIQSAVAETQHTPGGKHMRNNVHMVSRARVSAASAHTESRIENGSVSNQFIKGTDESQQFVTPPGGRRHRSRVRRVDSGRRFAFWNEKGIGLRSLDAPGPPDAANWITCAGYMNNSGVPITSLTTTWTVPPVPVAAGSQLIYLFNGIETANGQTILQPVLQWGDSGTDPDGQNRTGDFWTVASWLVGGTDDSATHTPHIKVNPGDVLVGIVTLANRAASGFTYTCEFQGLGDTILQTPEIDELVWCVQTLEAYELQGNKTPPYDLDVQTEYPATPAIVFQAITITASNSNPSGMWNPSNIVTTFGEHTTIDVNATVDGHITMYFS